jgi:hypothetical protein
MAALPRAPRGFSGQNDVILDVVSRESNDTSSIPNLLAD